MSHLRSLIIVLMISVFSGSLQAQSAWDVPVSEFNCQYEPQSFWSFRYPDGWQVSEQDEIVTINSPAITDLDAGEPIPEGEIRIIIDPDWQDVSYSDFAHDMYTDYGLSEPQGYIGETLYDEPRMAGVYAELHQADSTSRMNDLVIVSFSIMLDNGDDIDVEGTFIYEAPAGTYFDYFGFVRTFLHAAMETYNGIEVDCVTRASTNESDPPKESDQSSGGSVYIAPINAHLIERDNQQSISGNWIDFLPESDMLFTYQYGDVQIIDANNMETIQRVSSDEIETESASSINKFWIDSTGRQFAYNSTWTLVVWDRDDNSVVELGNNFEWYGATITRDMNRDSARFSPDGKILAYLSDTSEVTMVDIQLGQTIASFPVEVEGGVRSLVFHPDGSHLFGFIGSRVYVWDMSDYTQMQAVQQSEDNIYGWDISPDGRFLAWADWAEAWIWDWNSGSPVRIGDSQEGPNFTLEQHFVPVAFDATGQYLAFASIGNIVRVWDTTAQNLAESFVGHEEKILGIQFNSVGTILATFSQDNQLKFWDITSDSLLHSIDTNLYRRSFTNFSFLEFAGDGSYLLLAGNGIVHKYGFPAGADIPVPITESSTVATDNITVAVKPIAYEESIDATLSTAAGDQWVFSGNQGEFITIRMSSSEFDTTLQLLDSSGEMLFANDDANFAITDSAIIVELPTSDDFTIVAGTLDGSIGTYNLSVEQVTDDTDLINNSMITPQTSANNATDTPSPTPPAPQESTTSESQGATPEPTSTPSPTATMATSNAVVIDSCPGLMPSRLIPGERGQVEPSDGNSNRMRSQPSLSGREVTRIPPGGQFEVLDGPTCADGYAWYQVNYAGQIGWTAESGDGVYWLEPITSDVTSSNAQTDSNCLATPSGTVNLRTGPGTNYSRAGQITDAQIVTGRGNNPSGFVWYQLGNGFWVREDVITLSGDCSDLTIVR